MQKLAAWFNRNGVVLLAASIGCGLSFALFFAIAGWEEKYLQDEFKKASEERIEAVRGMLANDVDTLRVMNALFHGSHVVRANEFRVASGVFLDRRPHLASLKWLPRVPVFRRPSFEEAMRAEGFPGYAIRERAGKKPAAVRPEYFPIAYAEPLERQRRRLGCDYAADGETLRVLAAARDSAGFEIARLARSRRLVSVFLPVYDYGMPTATVEDRRKNLKGFVLAEIRPGQLVEDALAALSPAGIDVEVWDESGARRELLHIHHSRTRGKWNKPAGRGRPLPEREESFRVASLWWRIRCTPAPYFLSRHRSGDAWAVLFLGIVLTLMMVSHLRITIRRSEEVERLVSERTAALTEANALLQSEMQRRQKIEQRLTVQYFLSRILAECEDLPQAAGRMLPCLAEILDWEAGIVWLADEKGAMRCAEMWRRPDLPLAGFEAALRQAVYAPGAGLAGRVAETNRPVWENFVPGPEWGGGEEEALYLARVFGFPIRIGGRSAGVMAFFGRQIQPPDEELLQMFELIGGWIGRFIQQKDLERHREIQSRSLEQANKRLQELGRLKDEFVANTSHELRTPLTAIKEGIGLMLDEVLGGVNGEQKDFLKAVDQNIDRLTDLINNMLDLSKIEAGRMRLVRRRVRIRRLIEETLRTFQSASENRVIRTDLREVPDVYADPDRVLQVLANLFSNAIKFTGEGGLIRISTRERDGIVEIAVRDDGVGIPAEDMGKLFQKFSQVGELPHKTGTGLGLALCRELVELHKGTIRAASDPGKGAEFAFTLPAYTAQLALDEAFQETARLVKADAGAQLWLLAFDAEPALGALEEALADAPVDAETPLELLAEFVRKRLHPTDAVVAVEPEWLAVFALTDRSGVQAVGKRITKFLAEHVSSARGKWIAPSGAAVFPVDGADAQALFAKATSLALRPIPRDRAV